jgi:nucleoside-diphosphate-sugar epimerase
VKLLVLGGTRFVGRHLVEAALAAGLDPVREARLIKALSEGA